MYNSSLSSSTWFIKDILNQKCVDKCLDEIPYIKTSICVKESEKFYYEDDNGNKICSSNCNANIIIN